MAFFGLFGTAPGAYAGASLADKLALLGAGMDQRDPDALAQTQAGITARAQQAAADKASATALGGDPGLDQALGNIGIGGGPAGGQVGAMFAQALRRAMAGGGGGPAGGTPAPAAVAPPMAGMPPGGGAAMPAPAPGGAPAPMTGTPPSGAPAPAGSPPLDIDGQPDLDAIAAQHQAAVVAAGAPQGGLMGGAAPQAPSIPDAGKLMQLLGVASTNPRLASYAPVLEKMAQFYKPNIAEGSDGTYRNLNDPATVGLKSLPKDQNGIGYVADANSPDGYRAVATPGYVQADGDQKRAEAKGQAYGTAEVGTAPAPGWQLGPNGWVDPGGTAGRALAQNEGLKADIAAGHDMVRVDVPGQPGRYTYVSRADLGAGGGAMTPTPAGSKAAGRPTFNIPGASGAAPAGAPGVFGSDPAHTAYQAEDAKGRAADLKGYRDGLPQLATRGRAIDQLAALNAAGIGQGAANPLVQGVRSALSTLGYNSQHLNRFQSTAALKSTLLGGLTSGSGIQVRNQREFQAFLAKLPDGGNTQASNAKIISYLKADHDLAQRESDSAFRFANAAGGLDGTITRNGKTYNWDQVRFELYNRFQPKF